MVASSNTSALHVFETLREVCASREPVGVAEISRRLGLSLSTAQRALLTLTQSGYLKRHPYMAKYGTGFTTERLVNALLERFTVRPASVAFLRRIAASSRRTASLYVRIGWYSIRLVGIEAGHAANSRARRLGEAALLDSDAASLAILAHLSPEETLRFADFKLRGGTDPALPERLSAIRKNGFAYQRTATRGRGTATDPLESLAFPVFGVEGDALASVAIEGSPDEIMLDQHPAVAEWRDIVSELTLLVQTKRNLCVNPFSHLDPQMVHFGRREPDEQDEADQEGEAAEEVADDEVTPLVGAPRVAQRNSSRLLQSKVAVILGGGTALGRACALRFLAEGAAVVIADRDEAAGKETLRLARGSGLADVRYLRADAGKEPDVTASIALAIREFGRLDCLVNTASGTPSGATLLETTLEGFQSALNSLVGVFLGLRLGAQALEQQGHGGTLICATPTADPKGIAPALSSIASTTVVRLIQEFARELAPRNIRVKSLAPGTQSTPENFAGAAALLASDHFMRS